MVKVFRMRFKAELLMVMAWMISSPIIKEYSHLIGASLIGVLSIMAMMFGLTQKYLRENFSVVELLKMVIVVDLIYMLGIGYLTYEENWKNLVFFEMFLDGPYIALLAASVGKLRIETIGGFKKTFQNSIEGSIQNMKQKAAIIGLGLGTLLSTVGFNISGLITVKLVIMSIAVYIQIKAISNIN